MYARESSPWDFEHWIGSLFINPVEGLIVTDYFDDEHGCREGVSRFWEGWNYVDAGDREALVILLHLGHNLLLSWLIAYKLRPQSPV